MHKPEEIKKLKAYNQCEQIFQFIARFRPWKTPLMHKLWKKIMHEKGLLIHIDLSTVEFLEESKLQTGSKRNFLVIVDPSFLHQSFLLGPVCFIAIQSALHTSAPYLIPRERWKIRKRTSQLSASYDHATWQLPRENPRLVRESA